MILMSSAQRCWPNDIASYTSLSRPCKHFLSICSWVLRFSRWLRWMKFIVLSLLLILTHIKCLASHFSNVSVVRMVVRRWNITDVINNIMPSSPRTWISILILLVLILILYFEVFVLIVLVVKIICSDRSNILFIYPILII